MRINALTCINTVLDSLDKMMILDEVLPFLMDITIGQDAKIVMAVVGQHSMLRFIKFNTYLKLAWSSGRGTSKYMYPK